MLSSIMTLISDFHAAHVDVREDALACSSRCRPADRPALIDATGSVAALRCRSSIAPGALAARSLTEGKRLVSATDADGEVWLIPAAAVWSDWATAPDPQHPMPVGLATAPSAARAMVAGLSDRLGWEAVMHLERGADLPVVDNARGAVGADRLVVLDGRLGHHVPTVLLLGEDVVRWGAGATWDVAVQRALFGHGHGDGHEVEVSSITRSLAAAGLSPAAVDLGSPTLRRCGIVRSSIQLLAAVG